MSSFEALDGWRPRKVFSPEAATRLAPSPVPAERSAGAPRSRPEPLEERVRRAHDEGVQEGRAESLDGERARAFETLETAAQEVLELRDGYLSAHRREVVDLALAIAETLLGRPPSDDPDALAERLDQALSSLEPAGPLTLHLSVPDHAVVESDGASELGDRVRAAAIETRADPDLTPGEFRLEAGAAEADSRRATLLAALRERLLESLGEESP